MKSSWFLLAIVLCWTIADRTTNVHAQTLWDTLQLESYYNTFTELVQDFTPLVNLLQSTSANTTILVPMNDAWVNISTPPPGSVQLEQLLSYHFLPKLYPLFNFTSGQLIPTLLNNTDLDGAFQPVSIQVSSGVVTINQVATIIPPAESCDNGIILPINAVIFPPDNMTSTLQEAGYTTFIETVLGISGVPAMLNAAQRTVFAPSNTAFSMLQPELWTYLQSSYGQYDLHNFLLQCIIPNQILYSSSLSNNLNETALNGLDLQFTRNILDPSIISANGVQITQVDILAENGVGFGLSQVITPYNFAFTLDKLLNALNATLFSQAIATVGLANITSNETLSLTLFVPTNEAFAGFSNLPVNLLTELVQYHFVEGVFNTTQLAQNSLINSDLTLSSLKNQGQKIHIEIEMVNGTKTIYINNAQIIGADILAANGIVQVLDQVLIPPGLMTSIVNQTSEFVTIQETVTYLLTANYLNQLTTANLTLLIPSNSAWGDIPAGTANYLALNTTASNVALVQVLNNHVIPGSLVYTPYLPNGNVSYTTIQGESLTISNVNGWISINGVANITSPRDILYSNGVAQVIDAVIIPPGLTFTTANQLEGLQDSTFVTALNTADLGSILTGTEQYTLFVPNQQAWINLNNLNSLLRDKSEITRVVKAHIVSGTLNTLEPGAVYPTLLEGVSIQVVNDVAVKASKDSRGTGEIDLTSPASNGIIYEIDLVLYSPTTKSDSDKLSPGIVVLIVFLCVFFVIGCAVAGFLGYRYYSKKRGAYSTIN